MNQAYVSVTGCGVSALDDALHSTLPQKLRPLHDWRASCLQCTDFGV